ncbi:BZ3500_MvSof-1268-A1-R1_Chr1-2g01442 [Microbotryum saponariae]|uniref:BZ3500_MvSof-1268-A1-R1_Chr1-2g01442 protein n=1 Tax=Microbotryum saponariae TaxID=289078 RepID=A0A2X0KY93_9BASI|nr:BZ3500_MvSof-1268-A1-R1_Chr1-2g01442 [Microbotryum saponariae]SCZ97448.1 BZ3501_MvSof-1269-A2-R1_Chr1-2g01041 [Microbotryum saponariae]
MFTFGTANASGTTTVSLPQPRSRVCLSPSLEASIKTITHGHKILNEKLGTVPKTVLGQHQAMRQAFVLLEGPVDGESKFTLW